MIVRISPSSAFGRVNAPPSKSMAHRLLICGALSKQSVISGVAFSKDIEATLSCLKALGAKIVIEGDTVTIGGIDINKTAASQVLFCNESGSTLRFLIPLCLLFGQPFTLGGSQRLMERPLAVYDEICKSQGIIFKQGETSLSLCGKLSAGKYTVRGDISSQFISGLMFALPLLQQDSIIEITGNLESASYLNLTVKALADFGVQITRYDERTFYIKGNQTYKGRDLKVEGDYSNAAFLEAFNLIGGNVVVSNLSKISAQGDRVYKKMLAQIREGAPTLDISDCPDLAPVLIASAALKNGAVFTGTRRLKIKESDRGAAMAEELSKFGCDIKVFENKIAVPKCELYSPKLPLSSHNDHRIAMALSVVASVYGGEIYGAEAVSKSFPDYFERLNSLGIKTEVITLNET
ncbi:MAG: 3-phosphoshikimate 1-carboxyvinyltransferase [Ruminococcaceae bacterium]|nr:3-phosphoshikimate 1-carboxyvinyltransferase [Oscillospiraceae bacterium]